MTGAQPAGVTTPRAGLRPMREQDLDAVIAIEHSAYPFPWTQGIFRDCLRAGYPAWVLQDDDGRGLRRALLGIARGEGAQRVFLEVRPSNPQAVALYQDEGFNEIGRRPRYYPTHQGREDAIVMALELLPE